MYARYAVLACRRAASVRHGATVHPPPAAAARHAGTPTLTFPFCFASIAVCLVRAFRPVALATVSVRWNTCCDLIDLLRL